MRTLLSFALVTGLTLSATAQTGTSSPKATSKTATKSSIGQAAPKKPATATKAKAPAAAKPAPAASADPVAIFDTTAGKLTCTLFPKQAPKTVENFIGLATGTKEWTNPRNGEKVKGKALYSGTIFHRVIPNFMIQGGDPLGTGTGSPGYRFEDEFVPELRFDKPGLLAMANSGPATNGSQFFITEVPTPWLDPCLDLEGCDRGGRRVQKGYGHTIFGQCDDASVELVQQIARVATDPRNNRPEQDIKINSITIVGGPKPPASPAKRPAATPKKAAPTSATPKKG